MWIEQDNALHLTHRLLSFKQAMAFANAVAQLAEEANHHPSITINYNQVSLRLTTHDAGNTVTPKDHALAQAITALTKQAFDA